MKAWVAGLSVVAVLVVLIGYLVPDQEIRRPMWLFIFATLAAAAAYWWTRPEAPKSPTAWVGYIGLALIGGAFFAALDIVFLLKVPPGKHLISAALDNGWVLIDVAAAIGGSIVAAGGWAYSVARGQHDA